MGLTTEQKKLVRSFVKDKAYAQLADWYEDNNLPLEGAKARARGGLSTVKYFAREKVNGKRITKEYTYLSSVHYQIKQMTGTSRWHRNMPTFTRSGIEIVAVEYLQREIKVWGADTPLDDQIGDKTVDS